MITFNIEGKEIAVFPAGDGDRPVIYLNSFMPNGKQIHKAMRDLNCPDCTLAVISHLEWDNDMAPWDIPPISRGDTPCTGGADDYLRLMEDEIMPAVEKEVNGTPPWRGVAGYSLAGLFAVYSLYHTDIFLRAASMSGSFWFPGIVEYIKSHEMAGRPDCIYFSLGDKECRTNNQYLKCVQENTETIYSCYSDLGINTTFVLNPGNHYREAAGRTAAGLAWILNDTRVK
ncbi:MAG: alpha/beta hydrolase [Clostridiales bacterium]|nr:alpha/beta hydrolase [Clostridiales bacterium]